MWKLLATSLAVLTLLLPGCDEPAAPRSSPPPPDDVERPSEPSPWDGHTDYLLEPMEPAKNHRSLLEVSIVVAKKLEPSEITVVTDDGASTSWGPELQPHPASKHMGLLVRVSNNFPGLRINVGTHRFHLESATGSQMEPITEHKLTPALAECSLATGQTATGWVVFRVPFGETRFALISDLRRPRVELPITDHGG